MQLLKSLRRTLTAALVSAVVVHASPSAQAGSETVIISFPGNNLQLPREPLLQVGGTLLGTTAFAVFKIVPPDKLRVIHTFHPNLGDGQFASSGLVQFGALFYGTTGFGGSNDLGTVYAVSRYGEQRILHSFAGPDGWQPSGGLTAVGDVLYGTTMYGGSGRGCGNGDGGCGTVFSIARDGSERVVYSFEGGSDGGTPLGPLLYVDGKLYGTTSGACLTPNSGTVFSLTPGGTHKVLHTFGRRGDGAYPNGGLTSFNGAMFGTTFCGGTQNSGTIFSIKPDGVESVIYSFRNASGGCLPQAGLTAYRGSLYGTTSQGGYGFCFGDIHGTVFRLDPDGSLATVHNFAGSDGAFPEAALIATKTGLFGTTADGGAHGHGTVFSITP